MITTLSSLEPKNLLYFHENTQEGLILELDRLSNYQGSIIGASVQFTYGLNNVEPIDTVDLTNKIIEVDDKMIVSGIIDTSVLSQHIDLKRTHYLYWQCKFTPVGNLPQYFHGRLQYQPNFG